jgi:DNA-binding NarL/FixJ family response regulator
MAARQAISILIVDDHPIFRKSLRVLLEQQAFAGHIEEAGNGLECLEALGEKTFDLILMDIQMPKMDGIEATRQVHNLYPHIPVLGISMYPSPEDVLALQQAGAEGFVAKGSPFDDVLHAIFKLMNGTPCFPELQHTQKPAQ